MIALAKYEVETGLRVALGLSYSGTGYEGWQSQANGNTVQDKLEKALKQFVGTDQQIRTICAGRTDTGVHALNQVVHFDTQVLREVSSWVRGTNRYLPEDITVQWCHFVDDDFHARKHAISRRYTYILLNTLIRPSIELNRVGWYWRPLNKAKMLQAASYLQGEHDFSAFRASECQAPSPIKNLQRLHIEQIGEYWRFEFESNAFLHHMIRNLMGELIAVGAGKQTPERTKEVLESKQRELAAPTFEAHGLYFLGGQYEKRWELPETSAKMLILPVSSAG